MAVEILSEQDWAIPFSLVIDDKDDDQGDLVIEQVIILKKKKKIYSNVKSIVWLFKTFYLFKRKRKI